MWWVNIGERLGLNKDYPSHKDSKTKVNKSKVLHNAEIVACLSRIDLNLSKLASKNHKLSDLLSKGLWVPRRVTNRAP